MRSTFSSGLYEFLFRIPILAIVAVKGRDRGVEKKVKVEKPLAPQGWQGRKTQQKRRVTFGPIKYIIAVT